MLCVCVLVLLAMWSQLPHANINNETNFHYLPDKMLRQMGKQQQITERALHVTLEQGHPLPLSSGSSPAVVADEWLT